MTSSERTTRIQVDPVAVARCGQELSRHLAELTQLLDVLDEAVRELLAVWTGVAADAFAQSYTAWRDDFRVVVGRADRMAADVTPFADSFERIEAGGVAVWTL